MKRNLLLLAVGITMIAALTVPAAMQRADDPCNRTNMHSCVQQGLVELNRCFQVWGSEAGQYICDRTFDETYESCMLLKGCPNPPPPQW